MTEAIVVLAVTTHAIAFAGGCLWMHNKRRPLTSVELADEFLERFDSNSETILQMARSRKKRASALKQAKGKTPWN